MKKNKKNKNKKRKTKKNTRQNYFKGPKKEKINKE